MKTKSSGFITVRVMNGARFRRRTVRSRRIMPQRQLVQLPARRLGGSAARRLARGLGGLLTKGSAGELEEHGFEGGLGYCHIAETVGQGHFHQPREKPLLPRARRRNPESVRMTSATSGKACIADTRLSSGRSRWISDNSPRTEPALESGGRVDDENLAVVDDGDPVAQAVGFFHIVRGQQDRDSLLPQASHQFP